MVARQSGVRVCNTCITQFHTVRRTDDAPSRRLELVAAYGTSALVVNPKHTNCSFCNKGADHGSDQLQYLITNDAVTICSACSAVGKEIVTENEGSGSKR